MNDALETGFLAVGRSLQSLVPKMDMYGYGHGFDMEILEFVDMGEWEWERIGTLAGHALSALHVEPNYCTVLPMHLLYLPFLLDWKGVA